MKNTNIWKKHINVQTINSDYTATLEDHSFEVDSTGGAVTITLPSDTATKGKEYLVVWIAGSNAVTIDTGSGSFLLNDFSGNRSQTYLMEGLDDCIFLWKGATKWNLK